MPRIDEEIGRIALNAGKSQNGKQKRASSPVGQAGETPYADSVVVKFAAIPVPETVNPVDSVCQTPLKGADRACINRSQEAKFPEILVTFRKFAPVSTERSDATTGGDRTGSTAADWVRKI